MDLDGKTKRAQILKDLGKNPIAFCIDCVGTIDDASANLLSKVIINFVPKDSYVLISREISEKTQKHHFHVYFSNMTKPEYRRMRESKDGLIEFYKRHDLKLGKKTDDRYMGKINKIKDILMLQAYTIKDDNWIVYPGMNLFQSQKSGKNFCPKRHLTNLISQGLPAWVKGGHHCKGCNCTSSNKVNEMVEYLLRKNKLTMVDCVVEYEKKYERLPNKQTILLIMYRMKQITPEEYLGKIGL